MKNNITRISIHFWGDTLDPETISSIFNIQASKSHKKSDTEKFSSKKLGMWSYDQAIHGEFELELEQFINKFGGVKFKEILGVEIAILDVYLGLSDDESLLPESYEFRLNDKLLSRLGFLGLDIRVTIA